MDPPWDEYRRRRRTFRLALLLFPLWLVPGATIQEFLAGYGFSATSGARDGPRPIPAGPSARR